MTLLFSPCPPAVSHPLLASRNEIFVKKERLSKFYTVHDSPCSRVKAIPSPRLATQTLSAVGAEMLVNHQSA